MSVACCGENKTSREMPHCVGSISISDLRKFNVSCTVCIMYFCIFDTAYDLVM